MSRNQSSLSAFPHIHVVEASAGSGKTTCLTRRYLQLLLNPALSDADIPFKNILAITFSNKAALEMKARILETLKKIALDRFSTPSEKAEVLAVFGRDEAFLRRKANLAMEALLRHYNFFQVQTIDSFINAILCGCAFRLGLSAVFKIRTDQEDYLRVSLDRLLERAAHDEATRRLLRSFLMQYLRLENRTGWLPKEDMTEAMISLFSRGNTAPAPYARLLLSTDGLFARQKKILKDMEKLKGILPDETHKTFRRGLTAFLENHGEHFDTYDISAYFASERFPVTKGGRVGAEVKAVWERLRRQIRCLVEEESAAVFSPYMDIFSLVVENLRAVSKDDDVLFLEELNRRAAELFAGSDVSVPELYFRLSLRLKHFLIDEFQDTSVLQWGNLRLLVDEALACGGSLFTVGDRKQAIYRFRGGDAGLFDAAKAEWGNIQVTTETLSQNFRSQKAVVDFCNHVFSASNLGRFLDECLPKKLDGIVVPSEREEVLRVFEAARQEYLPQKDKGFVRVECVDMREGEVGLEAVRSRLMALLEDVLSRYISSDVALLARENDDVELLTQWLLARHIPVVSEKTLNIRNNACIKEIISLLAFLHSPVDDLAFASFILGDIFAKASGLDVSALHDFVFEFAQKKRREAGLYLYREFRGRFVRAWEALLEGLFRRAGFVPLYELTTEIFENFKVLENFASCQGYFMRLLELMKEEEEEAMGLESFLEFFRAAPEEKLYVRMSQPAGVRILTTHKAKGLGFGVVIVPFFAMNLRPRQEVACPSEAGMLLRRINEKTKSFSPLLEGLWRREVLKSFIDELNTAYVALTRAEEELYIFVAEGGRGSIPLRVFVIPDASSGVFESGAKRNKGTSVEALSVPAMAPARYGNWVQLLGCEFGDEEAIARRKSRLRGEALHAVLGRLRQVNEGVAAEGGTPATPIRPGAAAEEIAAAVAAARPFFPYFEDWSEIASVVRSVVAAGSLEPFFQTPAEIFPEKEIVDRRGQTRRVDRLMVMEKEVWVVDYKSSKKELAGGRRQMTDYISLIRELYPDKKIRGFLIFLDETAFEEVAAA